MKKTVCLLIVCVLFCGCGKQAEPLPSVRVVTGVEVELQKDGSILQRHYTRLDSIQAVLNYLRILKPFGPVIPETGDGDGCRITLHYSHGPDSVILQQGDAYLNRDNGEWEAIDDNRAALLYPMILLLPSDE